MKTKLTTKVLSVLVGSTVLFACSTFAADTNQITEPFKVTVTPATNRVHLAEKFKLHLRVENVSNTNQIIETFSCGWNFNWKSDSSVVRSPDWGCDSNIPEGIQLSPGDFWEKDLDMVINNPLPTNHASLHFGFTPLTPFGGDSLSFPVFNKTNLLFWLKGSKLEKLNWYWSNEVMIDLISN